ncbi:LLM class flavin-dependent oxidoreductase [Pseudofrankia inefficax]|uniref:Nitrilotriacetate monooxygenase component A/pristinamycin IIA synthase subunit A n=1 Tax=Pseudofrankia inefficax (strain DSM 45817 / CECT 9037 / DDB 130130 / EuI1c) TaxID=298654 RepID=E3IY22_PSEI1|nr:LLM class flavin-dependent oxidoreductase [Pseudofrankia inefficax]ADP81477.1 Nitrilotriacetate monooxygenase component A/pristinamycin IIA synthase subunit A [Pseudofrankia inefficax]
MTSDDRELHLNVNILDAGKHPGAWRFQDDPRSFLDIDYFTEIARLAEQGTFDAVFLSDGVALISEPAEKPWQALEPTVLLAALARTTEHVGLIGTASTTFNDPFNLARRFSSLDHLSRGRAALNVVTSYSPRAAANFGVHEVPDHEARYDRAEEFVDVLTKLWDSWDDDAIIADQEADVFADAARLRPIHHEGEHFSVRGPLNVPRSPQGRPVLVQAGSSETGKRFAARIADVVFTAQTTHREAVDFYADLKHRARLFGREPAALVILPGLFPIIGSTEAEAFARKAELDALFPYDLELPRLAAQLGLDPADVHLDRELPYDLLADVGQFAGSRGFFEATVNLARDRGYTVRELLLSNGGGHRQVVGSPEQIVDSIEHWFRSRAADGFNLNFDVFPSGLEAFVEHVTPELRRRGLFRSEYTGNTLRHHLGLPHPANQYAK